MTTRREFLLGTTAAGITAAIFRPVAGISEAESVNGLPGHAEIAQTVLGPLDSSKLGFTLPHEHVADGAYYLSKWPKVGVAEQNLSLKPSKSSNWYALQASAVLST